MWLVIAAFLASCGGEKGSAAGGAQDPDKAREKDDAAPAGKKWGGWRWKGAHDDCFFKHGGRCYNSMKMACRRAKCGQRECLKDGGAPAQVYCEGDEVNKRSRSAERGDEPASDESDESKKPKKSKKSKKSKKPKKPKK